MEGEAPPEPIFLQEHGTKESRGGSDGVME